jgi:hypothetical protein
MGCLNDLPVELLLNVACRLSEYQASLASLARVARKYRPVAEEFLYEAPVLPDVESGISSARLFLQTILTRPEHVKRVKKLYLSVSRQHSAHSTACKSPTCLCGLVKLRNNVFDTMVEWGMTPGPNLPGNTIPEWASRVPSAFEPALGGVILMLLPNLEDLDILTRDRSGNTWDLYVRRPPLTKTTTKDFFGVPEGCFNTSAIPGLAGLRRISFTGIIDWNFLRADTLKELVMYIDLSHPPIDAFKAPWPEVISTTITKMCLSVSADILGDRVAERKEYIKTLVRGLHTVQDLKIILGPLWNPGTLAIHNYFNLDNLVDTIIDAKLWLERLTIEMKAIFFRVLHII